MRSVSGWIPVSLETTPIEYPGSVVVPFLVAMLNVPWSVAEAESGWAFRREWYLGIRGLYKICTERLGRG
jgi:hypothetical protein